MTEIIEKEKLAKTITSDKDGNHWFNSPTGNKYLTEDADEDYEFEVKAQDLLKSNEKLPQQCAIAQALQRGTPKGNLLTDQYIGAGTAFLIIDNKYAIRYMLSAGARRAREQFDEGKGFPPGKYTLLAPSSSKKLGNRKPTGPHKTKGSGHSLKKIPMRHIQHDPDGSIAKITVI